MARKKEKRFSSGDADAAPNPFAALGQLRGEVPTVESEEATTDEPAGPRFASKVVVRRERSGRGGKTVTVVEGVLLDGEARDAFLKKLRKGLGTSGRVEGDRLVFGGEIVDRLIQQLEKAGANRVVRGN